MGKLDVAVVNWRMGNCRAECDSVVDSGENVGCLSEEDPWLLVVADHCVATAVWLVDRPFEELAVETVRSMRVGRADLGVADGVVHVGWPLLAGVGFRTSLQQCFK